MRAYLQQRRPQPAVNSPIPPFTLRQQTVWVDAGLSASFVFHFAAAWEDEEEPETIKLYAMKYDHFELDFEGTFFNTSDPELRFTRADLDAR